MPEINPLWIAIEHEDGKTTFEYQAGVYVTKEGQFRADLDDRLAPIAEKMDRERHEQGVALALGRNGKKWRIHGKVLGSIAAFIRACAAEYLACEKATERVIVHGHNLAVAVWVGADGSLHPNGCSQHSGGWFKGSEISSSRRVPYYSVGMCAAVYDKTTYRRKSGNTTTYQLVRGTPDVDADEDAPFNEPDAIILKLNAFTALDVNPESLDSKQMPYTPEAAAFFYRMMLSMCRMAIEMDSFFTSPAKLANAIKENRLLGPPGEPN